MISDREPWYYKQKNADNYNSILAGYVKTFSQNFVQMTVKGAGHLVPMDRPGPALQMITNFLIGNNNYSAPSGVSL